MLSRQVQHFSVRFHLSSLHIACNKVVTRSRVLLHLDDEQLYFKGSGYIKNNVAMFNSEIKLQYYSLECDGVTGLFRDHYILLVVELETHKVITKVGEVELNLARILKDRNGNLQTFRIAKCYDSYANIKMSITFESQLPKLNHIVDYQPSDVGKRMNDETIVFLEQKIEEDLRRISTLELANKYMQKKFRIYSETNDQQIDDLNYYLAQTLSKFQYAKLYYYAARIYAAKCQYESVKLKYKNEELQEYNCKLQSMLQKNIDNIYSLKAYLRNCYKSKYLKEKAQLEYLIKYKTKYFESEQALHKNMLDADSRLKAELEKHLIRRQHEETLKEKREEQLLRNGIKKIAQLEAELAEYIQKYTKLTEKYLILKSMLEKETYKLKRQYKISSEQELYITRMKEFQVEKEYFHLYIDRIHSEMDRKYQYNRQNKQTMEQLTIELQLSGRTIYYQKQQLHKFRKQIQTMDYRNYYLKEMFGEELSVKGQREDNLALYKYYYRAELTRYQKLLSIEREQVEEEKNKTHYLHLIIADYSQKLPEKNSALFQLTEQFFLLYQKHSTFVAEHSEIKKYSVGLQIPLSDSKDNELLRKENKIREWAVQIEQLRIEVAQFLDKSQHYKRTMEEYLDNLQFEKERAISARDSAYKDLEKEYEAMAAEKTKLNYKLQLCEQENQMLRTQLTTKMAEQRLVDMQLAEVREESEQFASIDLIKESQYSSYLKMLTQKLAKAEQLVIYLYKSKASLTTLITQLLNNLLRLDSNTSSLWLEQEGVDSSLLSYVYATLKQILHNRKIAEYAPRERNGLPSKSQHYNSCNPVSITGLSTIVCSYLTESDDSFVQQSEEFKRTINELRVRNKVLEAKLRAFLNISYVPISRGKSDELEEIEEYLSSAKMLIRKQEKIVSYQESQISQLKRYVTEHREAAQLRKITPYFYSIPRYNFKYQVAYETKRLTYL